MKLTGAAILVSRDMKVLQAAPAAYPYRSAAEGFGVDKLLLVAERGDERFEIVDDGGGVGLFVFRYAAGHNTHDYFQDDVSMCQRCAQAEWGLAPTAWRVAEPDEQPLWQRRAEQGAAADGGS